MQQRDMGFTLPPVHRLSQKARFPLGLSQVSSEVPAEIWEGGGAQPCTIAVTWKAAVPVYTSCTTLRVPAKLKH